MSQTTGGQREGRLNLGNFRYGKVERVKKIKDYAFVHFEERDRALAGENIVEIQKNISQ